MRVFFAVLLLLAASFVYAAPAHAATQPIHIVLVVPRDYPAYMDFNAARDEFQRWIELARAWFIREVGLTFDGDVQLLYSTHTIYEFNTSYTLDGCQYAPIPEGQGLDWNQFWSKVILELGWTETTPDRQWALVIGAGGWAGGQYYPRADFGRLILGDWGVHQAVLGTVDQCNPWGWDADPSRALGHEIMNSMGVDSYDPCCAFLGDPLSPGQKRDLKRYNKAFLRIP